eukprot:16871-Eustigmatos_ZCMA.PRE.1
MKEQSCQVAAGSGEVWAICSPTWEVDHWGSRRGMRVLYGAIYQLAGQSLERSVLVGRKGDG